MKTSKLYLMYLRKSRADADYSDAETLARHRRRLLDLCETLGIKCSEIIEEVGSADSIAARPGMLRLLSLIESGNYEAVVCVDMDRLSRGSGADQALLINTLKYSETKVITPFKTYDFANDSDETFAEFNLFFAKNEYRAIKRRMQQGRADAAREGKWISGINAPYGYEPYKLKGQKGYSLQIVPNRAQVVQMIFDLYTEQNMGTKAIAAHLNKNGFLNQFEKPWSACHIYKILKDPVYIGKIRFQKYKKVTKIVNGLQVVSNVRNPAPNVYDGLHEPIISEEQFKKVQQVKETHHIPHTTAKRLHQNPFAGIMRCANCGKMLALRSPDKKGKRSLYCTTPGCNTRQAYLEDIEEAVLYALGEWLNNYTFAPVTHDAGRGREETLRAITLLNEDLTADKTRLKRVYQFFEDGIYTAEEFRSRANDLNQKIETLRGQILKAEEEVKLIDAREKARAEWRPQVQTIIEVYNNQPTAADKNRLLKMVVDHITYTKTGSEFELDVFPLLPQ